MEDITPVASIRRPAADEYYSADPQRLSTWSHFGHSKVRKPELMGPGWIRATSSGS